MKAVKFTCSNIDESMPNGRKIAFLAATALATIAAPAWAQDNSAQAGSAQTSSSQDGSSTDGGGTAADNEIVVTAQFHAQDLQSTPLAITAVSGADLNARGIENTQDLARVAPSVTLRHTGSHGGKTLAAYIRGVGASDENFNVEPGVATYLDDVYLGPSFGTLIDFMDLDQVEILRGPQGTLSGKNAIGGAIRLVSAKPKGDNSGYIDVETGSRRLIQLRAAYDVGLSDNLALRISGYSANQDGLVQVYDFACLNPTLVGDQSAPHALKDTLPGHGCKRGKLGGTDVHGGRVQLRWTPTDTVEINLAGDYIDDNSDSGADVIRSIDPSGFANFVRTGDTNPFFVEQYGVPYDQRFLPPDRYSTYATFEDPVNGIKFKNSSAQTTKDATMHIVWRPTDNLTLTSISGYRKIDGQFAYDSDASPLQTDGVYDRQTHEQYSQEVRLSGVSLDDRLNWTVGGFYYKANETDNATVEAVIYDLIFTVNSVASDENYAGFAHAEFKITDGLTAIGGIRRTHEDKLYHFIETDIPGTRSNIFPGGLNAAKTTKYDRTDWRLGLQYQIDPNNMIYVDAATGFRGGGFNPRPSTLADVTPFGPESLTTYEFGQRSEFLDHRIKWNNTLYYGDYKNIQLYGNFISDTPDGAYPVTDLTNAGKARIWGIESEFDAHLGEGIDLRASGSYTNFKYQDLGVAAPLAGNGGPTLDSTQPYTPKWQFDVGFDAVLPVLEKLGTLTLTADYAYQTKQYTDSVNSEAIAIPAYGVANARLTLETLNSGWQFSVIGTNIFNQQYDYNRYYISGNYQISANPAPGAEWAISARKKF